MEDPTNLKTLAQFVLLGDPSLQPCGAEGKEARANVKIVEPAAAREARRIALVAAGKAASESSGYPGKRLLRPPKSLHTLVRKLARQRGFRARPQNFVAFQVVGGGNYGLEMKKRGVEQKVLMLIEHAKLRGRAAKAMPKGLQQTRVFVAHAQNNHVTEVAEYVRK